MYALQSLFLMKKNLTRDSTPTGTSKSLPAEMLGTIPGHARLVINAQKCVFLLCCEIQMSVIVQGIWLVFTWT
jgi:hypothetical protein